MAVDTLIRTTAQYQDLPTLTKRTSISNVPVINVVVSNEIDRKQHELRSKLDKNRENPFKPNTKIYNSVEPIVEQFKRASSRPTTPSSVIAQATNKSTGESQFAAAKDQTKRLKLIGSDGGTAQKSCWRRLCCCCNGCGSCLRRYCCCCCCKFKKPKIQSVESPGGTRKLSKLAGDKQQQENSDTQLTLAKTNKTSLSSSAPNEKSTNTTTTTTTTATRAAQLASETQLTKEELHAKRIEFIKNLNLSLSLNEQHKTSVLYNLRLPDNYEPIASALGSNATNETAAGASANAAGQDDVAKSDAVQNKSKRRLFCC